MGTREALLVSSIAVAISLLVMWRHPTRLGEEAEVTPSTSEVPVFSFAELQPQDGPVAIQIAYQVHEEDRQEFLRRIHAVGSSGAGMVPVSGVCTANWNNLTGMWSAL